MPLWNLLICVALSATPPEVELQTVDGEQLAGPLVEWTAEHVVLGLDPQPRTLNADELASMGPKTPSTAEISAAKVEVQLIDGSSFGAMQYTAREGKADVVLPGDRKLSVPTDAVSAVRLQTSGVEAAQWERVLKNTPTADLLVVQRAEGLDYHKGVIREVTDSQVVFELDGEALPVKRSKVAGLIYYHPRGAKLPEAICRIVDQTGARWIVREVRLDVDLHWTTVSGVACSRPLAELKRVEFSSDKVLYLSDLKPESADWVPLFAPDKPQEFLTQFFAPRQNRAEEGNPLALGGKTYRKGLSMNSRSTIVFRLPDRYRRLKGVAGIADAMRPRGVVHLVVRGDDRVLLETDLSGTDPVQNLDLDVSGVKRLTLIADFGAALDQGSRLLLCEARVIK